LPVRAVIFDFIGTLVKAKNCDFENSKMKLCKAIMGADFDVCQENLLNSYNEAHEKYRIIRYQELVEVANTVWISEALNNLGFKTTPQDTRIKTAVNVFFEDYLESLELRPCVKALLEELSADYRLGLVSNFTYAPVIYAGLRKLDISQFFNAILVSEAVGWRKPHAGIFKEALQRLQVNGKEVLYVGDSPLEDIKGAKAVGMKTVFVPSQFYPMDNLRESGQKPDNVVKDICELHRKSSELICRT